MMPPAAAGGELFLGFDQQAKLPQLGEDDIQLVREQQFARRPDLSSDSRTSISATIDR